MIMGTAGVSAGFEIAGRVGLQPSVVERARSLLGGEDRRAEDYLDRLHRMTRDLEEKQAEAERTKREQQAEYDRRNKALEAQFDKQRQQAAKDLERAIADFRRRAEVELGEIRGRRAREKAEGRVAGLQAEARLRHEEVIDPDTAAAAGRVPDHLEPGMEVFVRSLGRSGTILRIEGARVEVRLGRMPFTVDRSELRVGQGTPPPTRAPSRTMPRRSAEPESDLEPAAPSELMLIGKRVDEGLEELDRFLDEASVASLGEVRIVHGHGTGRLRRAVREFLTRHAHVREYRPGKPREGGDGATVVTLR